MSTRDEAAGEVLCLPEDINGQVKSVREGYAAKVHNLQLLEVVGMASTKGRKK